MAVTHLRQTASACRPDVRASAKALSEIAGQYDVAIVGGGPAGSALAALLARHGRQVALFEKDRFPRHKLCGEFLSPESRHWFDRIGCLDRILDMEPSTIRNVRFTSPAGAKLELPLPGEGLGLSRLVLDQILFQHASRCGASTFEEAEVIAVSHDTAGDSLAGRTRPATVKVQLGASREDQVIRELQASLVIIAHGRRSRLDHHLGRPFLRGAHPHLGFKRHMIPVPGEAGSRTAGALEGTVEVHGFPGGYCGISFVENGRVNVCALIRKSFIRRLASPRWESLVEALRVASSPLRSCLEGLEPADDQVHVVAGVPLCEKDRATGSILYLGDAAGMIAPLCGDGQAMALRSGILLAKLLDEQGGDLTGHGPSYLAREWDRRWRREFSRRMRLGRWLQSLLLRPGVADLALRTTKAIPALGRALVRSTRGM